MTTALLRKGLVRGEGGFTLVEMVAAMAILMVAVVAFTQLFSFTIKRSSATQEQAAVQTEARAGIDAFARDLREALCNDQAIPITVATGSQLTFYTPDEVTPYHLEQVSYQVTGGNFQRERVTSTNTSSTGPPWTMPSLSTTTWGTVFGSVTNSAPYFKYYDASGVSTATLANIARVDLQITVQPRTTTSATDGATTYNQSVDLRTPTCN